MDGTTIRETWTPSRGVTFDAAAVETHRTSAKDWAQCHHIKAFAVVKRVDVVVITLDQAGRVNDFAVLYSSDGTDVLIGRPVSWVVDVLPRVMRQREPGVARELVVVRHVNNNHFEAVLDEKDTEENATPKKKRKADTPETPKTKEKPHDDETDPPQDEAAKARAAKAEIDRRARLWLVARFNDPKVSGKDLFALPRGYPGAQNAKYDASGLRKRYMLLCLLLHPDKNVGEEDIYTPIFKRLQSEYDRLTASGKDHTDQCNLSDDDDGARWTCGVPS